MDPFTARRCAALRHLVQRVQLTVPHAVDVEEAVFTYLGSDSIEYQCKMQQLCCAMQRPGQTFSRHAPAQLVRLTPDELAAGTAAANVDVQAAFVEQCERQLLNDAKSAALSTGKGVLQCKSCKSYRIDLKQRQSRSADEGMDTYCRCIDCLKTWKMS